ncbi:MAG: hypothetical protein DRP54_02705 [Spirochaetes bacterium]|nr:MAG: hypothetical protein DRP54_02705 [Spirochaetota bacterium]
MGKESVSTEWKGEMKFEAEVTGHKVTMDSTPEFGGHDEGPRPKPLVLASLAGCTGMDVVSILKKMKVNLDGFKLTCEADVADEHPKIYTNIKLIYEFRGKGLDRSKLEKAVSLSQERYCGVSAMLRKNCPINYEIRILEE